MTTGLPIVDQWQLSVVIVLFNKTHIINDGKRARNASLEGLGAGAPLPADAKIAFFLFWETSHEQMYL